MFLPPTLSIASVEGRAPNASPQGPRACPILPHQAALLLAQRYSPFTTRYYFPFCFHTLTHSFALRKTLSPFPSSSSALLCAKHQGVGTLSRSDRARTRRARHARVAATPIPSYTCAQTRHTRHTGTPATPMLSYASAHFPSHRGWGASRLPTPQVLLQIFAGELPENPQPLAPVPFLSDFDLCSTLRGPDHSGA